VCILPTWIGRLWLAGWLAGCLAGCWLGVWPSGWLIGWLTRDYNMAEMSGFCISKLFTSSIDVCNMVCFRRDQKKGQLSGGGFCRCAATECGFESTSAPIVVLRILVHAAA
jgi:hypothetical protein